MPAIDLPVSFCYHDRYNMLLLRTEMFTQSLQATDCLQFTFQQRLIKLFKMVLAKVSTGRCQLTQSTIRRFGPTVGRPKWFCYYHLNTDTIQRTYIIYSLLLVGSWTDHISCEDSMRRSPRNNYNNITWKL